MGDYERIAKVIRHLDRNFRDQPSLAELAKVTGLSEFHFHRLFSRWAGTTPKAFLKALTASHARSLLLDSSDLLSASLESGLSGPGRLHDLMVSLEGMTPGQLKARGAGLVIEYAFDESPLGRCIAAATPRGICHLAFVDEGGEDSALEELRGRWPEARLVKGGAKLRERVARAFGGRGRPVPVIAAGTPFQLKVWQALLRVPEGRVISYGDLAAAVGHPGAARAVGSAVAANSIAVLIPCHRVIRETGVIGDYRWGTERKRALLARELQKPEA